jgi:lipoprotein NlpD
MTSGCAGTGSYQPATYVVRPQDTLYSIAWRHNLDYREMAKWNHLGTDYRLTVGQVLVLSPSGAAPAPVRSRAAQPARAVPPARAVQPAEPLPGAPLPGAPLRADDAPKHIATVPSGAVGGTSSAAANLSSGSKLPAGDKGSGGGLKWVWPTDEMAAPRPVPGGGILLLGRLGQDIRAAGSGRVVYSGSGLRGYGNLIIIKHGDSLLSSYAHNREMLVHEGEEVSAGQVIAHMGTGAHQICALYFEIRVNGKPIDPLRYLGAPSNEARRR